MMREGLRAHADIARRGRPGPQFTRVATQGRVACAILRGVIRENFREYLDDLLRDGYSVRHDGHTSDPDLIDPQGNPVYTWQEGYPYAERMERDEYELEKYRLQIELLKFQYWLEDNGQRAIILFEGRDAAGKGGTIKRFTEHLNPRTARMVALTKPTEREHGQWYFQRYVQHLPTAGEIVMFDRSWYNRAGVERVMGYCTDAEYEDFMVRRRSSRRCWSIPASTSPSSGSRCRAPSSAPGSRSGSSTRCAGGSSRPTTSRRWIGGRTTRPRRRRCSAAPTRSTLRGSITCNDKKRARINAMRFFLGQFDYEGKDAGVVYPAIPCSCSAATTRSRTDRGSSSAQMRASSPGAELDGPDRGRVGDGRFPVVPSCTRRARAGVLRHDPYGRRSGPRRRDAMLAAAEFVDGVR